MKPPQSPTVRNKAQLPPSLAVRLNKPHKSPIRKQPTRFTDSVAQGNPLPMPFISSETRYLAAPPMKLPAPTTATFLMISKTIEFRFVGVKLLIFRDMLKLEVAPVVLSAGPPTPLPLRRRLRPSRRQAAAKVSRLHRLCHLGRPDFVLPAQTPETVPPPRLAPPSDPAGRAGRLSVYELVSTKRFASGLSFR